MSSCSYCMDWWGLLGYSNPHTWACTITWPQFCTACNCNSSPWSFLLPDDKNQENTSPVKVRSPTPDTMNCFLYQGFVLLILCIVLCSLCIILMVYYHIILSYILYDRLHQMYSYDSLFPISLDVHYTSLKELLTFDYLFDFKWT